jgi:uncharacterized protein YndB with AHSA1/START domain
MFPMKRLLWSVVGAAALVASGGWLLPRHARVERTITINAPIETVFAEVNDLGSFRQWSPWTDRDPSMHVVAGSPSLGRGARLVWDGDPVGVGSGTLEISESRPSDLVRIKMDFGPQGSATMAFQLAQEQGGTRATWTFDMDLGFNPVGRYFGPFFDKELGPDFERGLRQLKRLCEGAR